MPANKKLLGTLRDLATAVGRIPDAFRNFTQGIAAQNVILERQAVAEEALAASRAPAAADTPRSSYAIEGSSLALTTSYQPISVSPATESIFGNPTARLDVNGRIANPSGRAFLYRLIANATATPPSGETDADALAALGIVVLSALGTVGIARRKRTMGYGCVLPIVQLAIRIGDPDEGTEVEIIVDQKVVGWGGDNDLLYTSPAYSLTLWRLLGGQFVARIKPCPSYAESGVPSVTLNTTAIDLFNIESFTAAATGS